jgi:hypothetical protein
LGLVTAFYQSVTTVIVHNLHLNVLQPKSNF